MVNFPTVFISFLKSPLVTRKRLMKTVGRLKLTQIMAFLQSSSAFFKFTLSNQKKADENCRKIKVTQITILLQSSSAFFKIALTTILKSISVRVSVQGVKSLGGHFAKLFRELY